MQILRETQLESKEFVSFSITNIADVKHIVHFISI
jgi:hypothetical protein